MSEQPSYFMKLFDEAVRTQDREKLELWFDEYSRFIMNQHLFVGLTLADVKVEVLMELRRKARESMDHQLIWHEFELSEPPKEN